MVNLFFLLVLLFCKSVLGKIDSPIIQPIPISGNIIEGQKFKLGCTVFSGSTPIKFEWYKNDKKIKPGEEFSIRSNYEDSSDLIINPVRMQNSGLYVCVASNGGGSDSTRVEIRVQGTEKMTTHCKVDCWLCLTF